MKKIFTWHVLELETTRASYFNEVYLLLNKNAF